MDGFFVISPNSSPCGPNFLTLLYPNLKKALNQQEKVWFWFVEEKHLNFLGGIFKTKVFLKLESGSLIESGLFIYMV